MLFNELNNYTTAEKIEKEKIVMEVIKQAETKQKSWWTGWPSLPDWLIDKQPDWSNAILIGGLTDADFVRE